MGGKDVGQPQHGGQPQNPRKSSHPLPPFPVLRSIRAFYDRVENPVGCAKLTRLKLTRPSLRPNDSSYQWSRRLPATVLVDHKAFRHQILGFSQLGVAIV